ncbi:13898_t:CDS:2, partial [Racocetra fulgida]
TATTSKEGSRRANYPIPTRGVQFKSLNEEQLEGKSGASSRGNSSSNSLVVEFRGSTVGRALSVLACGISTFWGTI